MDIPVDPKKAAEAREAGNAAYKKGKWAEAVGHYAQAARWNPTDPAPYLNRAQAYIKLEKWQDVIRDCTTVLSLPGHGDNVKALYRRALARQEVGEAQGAIQDLERVLKIEPNNSASKEELINLKKSPKSSSKEKQSSSLPAPKKLDIKSTDPTPPKGTPIPIKIVPNFTPRTSAAPSTTAGPSTPKASFAQQKDARTKQSYSQNSTESPVSTARNVSPMDTNQDPSPDAQAQTLSGLVPPVSGLDLIDRIMDTSSASDRWNVMTSLPASRLATWLDPFIEPDHLAVIYETMHSRADSASASESHDRASSKSMIEALRAMKRWKMAFGMLSRSEKETVRRVEEWCL